MAAHTRVAVGYNAQVAVDAKHKLIVEQAVTNQVLDLGLLTQIAEPARAILGATLIDVVADRGYFKFEYIEACEAAGMTPYVPKPQRGSAVHEGFFTKDVRYDRAEDAYICPAGERLGHKYEGKSRNLTRIDYSNRAACLACSLRPRCTNSFRRVSRLENEAVLDSMAARRQAVPEVLDARRDAVENIWAYLRGNKLSNRVFDTYDTIVDACCDAWNWLTAQPKRIASIATRSWATVSA